MSNAGENLADAAMQFVGAPYKFGGRSPKFGLDCVGLVACSLAMIGKDVQCPKGYSLRNSNPDKLLLFAGMNGFARVDRPEERGDLALLKPGPAQLHLAIANGRKQHIHAHAGARRVVLSEIPENWPVLARWQLSS